MSVHYKFKSGKEAHTITFDSLHISVGELKKAIMQQRKIGKSADLDLQITNAQTKEVYESDSILIPKNTSVIVARVPVANSKKSWNKSDNNKTNDNYITSEDKIVKNNFADGSEDDKIKEMLNQSTKDYDPSKYARGKGPLGPLPPNYTCYRCGKPGHYIKHCPTNNIDVKRSTGIPRSFMIPAKADQKGAMITASGEYAVPIIDHDAYREVKKEKPPFFSTENEPEIQKVEIPEDLKCFLCNNLLQDAVLIPCCGNSFCDECIRLLLLESDNHECPSCKQTDVSPDTLIPNRFLRISVAKFKNETGFGTRPPNEETKNDDISKSPSTQEKLEDNTENYEIKESSKAEDILQTVQSTIDTEEHLSDEGESINDHKDDEDESKIADLYEVVKKEPKDDQLNEQVPEVKTEKESEISSDHSSHIEIIQNGINEIPTSLSILPNVINPIHTLQPPYSNFINNNNRYRNQIRVRSSGQPNQMFTRVPGQMMMPRNNFNQNRTLLPHDAPFFNDHMQPFSHMGLPMSYGYGPQIRGQIFDNIYNMNPRAGQINPLLPFTNNMNMGAMNGPMMESEGAYYPPYKYDDYEDKLERFNRQLESRSRRNDRLQYNRSRSRSGRSKSRSKSYSSASSRSSSLSRSRRSRRRSPNSRQYGRRERSSRSRSPHRDSRYPKSSASYNRHNRRSESNYDKRNERPIDRNEKDKERKYRSIRRERDPNKETIELVRKSVEKQMENTKKEENDRTQDQEEDKSKMENEPSHSSDTNANIDQYTNKDSNLDKVGAPETADIAEVKGNESPKPVGFGKGDEKTKPASKRETKAESSRDSKDKFNRHSKSKRNHSRSRSVSQSSSSDSSSDQDTSKSKKRNKKNSKDSSKSKSSDRHKSKSKHDRKSAEKTKPVCKSDKSLSDNKHDKNSEDKSMKLSKEEQEKSKGKLSSGRIDYEPLVDISVHDQFDIATDVAVTCKKDNSDQSLAYSNESNQINKSEEMEIKIQEDYSDLENEEISRIPKTQRDSTKQESSSNHNNKENLSKSSHESKLKEGKSSEESHRKVKISTSKLTEKPLLSVTIENKTKIGSKISLKDKEEAREKDRERDRDKRKDKERKSDKAKDRAKEKNKGGKSKDRHRDRDRDHSSHKEHKFESSSSKSKSKDKKRDKEKAREKDDRSKRSHRRSRSSSVSARKKIKSEIDTSTSKHKSSKSHRK